VEELDPILAAALDPTRRPSHTHTPECLHDQQHCPARRPGVGGLIGVPVTGAGAGGRQVWFTPSQWELMVCNADISETLLDRLGMPIAVRERVRFPNRAMRRALDARDGGCVFPGCDAPAGWCDAHHVSEYAHDGQTVTSNLVLLCRHHHGIVHRSGWSMRLTTPDEMTRIGDGLFTITTADGLHLHTEHRRRQPAPA
ncbi:MAG: HNH endonuclease, partial [Actinobacteria bacterium]|nr:HNH endonuclease [Actinomycetota bacterium]